MINSSTGTYSGSIGTARSLTAGTIQTLTASTLSGTLTGGTYTGSIGTSCNFTVGTIGSFNSTTGTIAYLNSTTSTLTNLNSTNGTIANGTITTLNATNNATIAGITVGSNAGSSGLYCTVVGAGALDNNTGEGNSAFGYRSLDANTSGSFNTGYGAYSGYQINSGSHNTSIGYAANSSITTGSSNTSIGHNAGSSITTGTFNTSIGYNAQPLTSTSTGNFTLGDATVNNLRCADTTISALSDIRDKSNIQDIPVGLDYIKELRPVMFDWAARDGSRKGKKDFGFIAQELDQVQNKFGYSEHTRLVHKDNSEAWEADVMKTYPILVKSIQQLSAKVDSLEAQLASK